MCNHRIKLLLVYCVCFLFFKKTCDAQEMLGFCNSNYAGTNGVIINPASMSHSRLKWDINILTLDFFGENDYAYIPKQAISTHFFTSPVLTVRDLTVITEKNAYVNYFIEMPSAMLNMGKNSYGISFRWRNNAYMHGFAFTPRNKLSFTSAEFRFDAMSWGEIGASYSRVIKSNSKNSLAAGITFRKLFGFAAVYTTNNTRYYASNTTASSSFAEKQFGRALPDANKILLGTGDGIDIGISYQRTIAPEKFLFYYQRKSVDFYRYKVGASLVDIGSVKFEHNTRLYGFGTDSLLFTIIFGNPVNQTISQSFTMVTPAALCLTADYNIAGPFFVNSTYFKGIRIPPDPPILRPDQISLAFRFETRNLEITFPYSKNGSKLHRIGFALRVRNIVIGTDKLGSVLGPNDVTGFDFYLAIKILSFKEIESKKAYTCKKKFNKKV